MFTLDLAYALFRNQDRNIYNICYVSYYKNLNARQLSSGQMGGTGGSYG